MPGVSRRLSPGVSGLGSKGLCSDLDQWKLEVTGVLMCVLEMEGARAGHLILSLLSGGTQGA